MALRSGCSLNSSLSARILYFAASTSEKNVAHSKDNTNSTHLKIAEMLKNIEIIELVDLSRDVGRVLQINFVSIFFWLCAFVDACKACKSLSRSYSKVQPILRLQQRKVQVVLMHQR